MITHNICFHGEIRKISILSVEKKKKKEFFKVYLEQWTSVEISAKKLD